MKDIDLLERQAKHTQDLAKLVIYAKELGYNVVITETGLISTRRIELPDGTIAKGRDCVHKKGGRHYDRQACDLVVYDKDWNYLDNGSHPVYELLGTYWESLDSENRNGRKWGDANHFSRIYKGVQ